jgi:hypothetical protein
MRFRYTRIQTFETEINPENYPVNDPHAILLVDLDSIRDDPNLFFDRSNLQTQYKVELIENGKVIDSVVCNNG